MRIRLRILSLVAALTAAAAERPTIGLITEFPASLDATLRQQFRQETERALRPAGVNLIWREVSEVDNRETFNRLVIIRFEGECSEPAAFTRSRRGPLGLTHVSEGTVLPFVQINCRRVLEVMADGNWHNVPHYELAVGRALARVAAHEIYHALTASESHDSDGLMRPSFSGRDLLGLVLEFSQRSVSQLKISLGTAAAQSSLRTNIGD